MVTEKPYHPTRRAVLKAGGGTIALAGLTGVTLADETIQAERIRKGTRDILELQITHPNASDDIGRGVGCAGTMPTILDSQGLYLVSMPVSRVQETPNKLLRSPLSHQFHDGEFSHVQRDYFTDVENGFPEYHLNLWDGYEKFEFTVSQTGTTSVVNLDGEMLTRVAPGGAENLSLDERNATIRPSQDETREVTLHPELRVQNWGPTPVYGVKNGMVLPTSGEQQLHDHLIQLIRSGRGVRVTPVDGADIVVVQSNGGGD